MREIKFRAFLKSNQVMYDVLTLDIIDKKALIENAEKQLKGYVKLKEIELMQYTGLKDKNGKEIYECDILTSAFSKRIVIFNENTCSFMLKDIELRNELFSLTNEKCKNLEIIGNIYENKELIGEKKL